MTVETKISKTVEESQKICLDVRKRKESVIEIIHKFTQVIDTENLLKMLPKEIADARKALYTNIKEIEKLEPEVESQALFNDQFKVKVGNKETELSKLKSEVSCLKSTVEIREESVVTINGYKNEIAQLEKDKVTCDSKIREQESEVLSLEQENSSMQEELGNNKVEEEKLDSERCQLVSYLESLTNELNGLEGSGGRKSDLDEVEKKAIRLEKDKDTAESKVRKQEHDIEGLKQEISSMQDELEKNKEETVNLGDEKSQLISDLEVLTKEADSLEASGGKKSDLDALEQEISRLKSDRDTIGSKVGKQELEIQALKQETSSMKDELENNKKESVKLDAEKVQLTSDIEILSKELKGLENSNVKKIDLDKLTDENENVAKKNNTLKEAIDRENQSKLQAKSSTESLNKEIAGLENVLNGLNSQAVSLSQSVMSKEEIDELQTRYELELKERDTLGVNIHTAEVELQNTGSVKEEIMQVHEEFEVVQNEFNEFKGIVGPYENDPEQFEKLKSSVLELEKIETEFKNKAAMAEKQLTNLSNQSDIAAITMKCYREPLDEINKILNS